MRVLVVEAEVRMAGLLQRALKEEGHAGDVATDGPGVCGWPPRSSMGQSSWT
jgi:DNA-binding response OmpR family regulator